MTDYTIQEIKRIVTDCEEYQKEPVSDYAKEREMISAYEHIAEMVRDDKEAAHE